MHSNLNSLIIQICRSTCKTCEDLSTVTGWSFLFWVLLHTQNIRHTLRVQQNCLEPCLKYTAVASREFPLSCFAAQVSQDIRCDINAVCMETKADISLYYLGRRETEHFLFSLEETPIMLAGCKVFSMYTSFIFTKIILKITLWQPFYTKRK